MTPETGSAAQRSTLAMTVLAIGKVGSFATVGVGLLTDVLEPVGPLALYLAAVAVALLVVLSLPERVAQPVHAFGKSRFERYWRAPVLATVAVSALLLVGAHLVTRSAPAGGWLGEHVSAVRDLQGQLGVLEAQSRGIAQTTRDIKRDTEEINAKLDEVKKERSDDPRKELANLGVVWSTQSFVDALQSGDARTVELFLRGGMSPAVLHNGASAVLYMLQPRLPDPIPMLKLFVAAGFDLGTNLFDGRIMREYGDLVPPHFESPDLPDDYAAWQRTFGGPVMLWLTIRSSYGITEDWDIPVLEFLKSEGANTKLARDFLTALEYAWGDTPTYQRVRDAVD